MLKQETCCMAESKKRIQHALERKGKSKRIGTQNCVPSRVVIVIPKKVHMRRGDLHELDNPKFHY